MSNDLGFEDDLLQEMLGEFLDESDELLNQLNENLLNLDEWVTTLQEGEQAHYDDEQMNEMFRAAHYRVDEIVAEARQGHWETVQRMGQTIAAESERSGYTAVCEAATRLGSVAKTPAEQRNVTRSLIKLIGAVGRARLTKARGPSSLEPAPVSSDNLSTRGKRSVRVDRGKTALPTRTRAARPESK